MSTSGGDRLATRVTEGKQTDQRPPIAVKGVKGGLLFVVDEQCPFELLLEHGNNLLNGEFSNLFNGPETAVSVDFGKRPLTREESKQLLELFLAKENFLLKEFSGHTAAKRSVFHNHQSGNDFDTIYKGTVRAGQQLVFDGDVTIIGDVNPGGEVVATGDIYVLGRLRGVAHAGAEGNETAIIAAAEFAPMQLRIADWVSRAPESDGKPLQTYMEFAYIREDGMAVDRLMYVHSVRNWNEGSK